MPSPTHVCIRNSMLAIEKSQAHLCSLLATLDRTEVAVSRSRALLPPRDPAADENEAESRMRARIVEALLAAGYTFEVRYLGAPLH
jgi:hypothetical protein